jgi:hypothetical protein
VTKTHVIPQKAVILDIRMRCDRAGPRGDLRFLHGAVFCTDVLLAVKLGRTDGTCLSSGTSVSVSATGILRLIEVMGAAPSGSSTVRLRSTGIIIKGLELSLKDRSVEERRGSLLGHFEGT